MTSRKMMMSTQVALVATLMISLPSLSSAQDGQGSAPAAGARISAAQPSGAQGRRRGGGEPEYTPAAGARDLKSVLFNWAWYTGMLRSTEERDLIMTLVYQGKGTIQVDGQPCNVTKYRTSIS